MSKEKYLLQKIVSWWDDDKEFIGDFVEEIRAYLAEQTQDEKAIAYWDTQNGTLIPAVPLSSKRTCFEVPRVPLYLHPAPRPEFVRLSEEEVDSLTYAPYEPYKLICAVENLLVEKNNAF